MTFNAPGQFCTMILGDLGADVLKIERPLSGERLLYEKVAHGVTNFEEQRRQVTYNALERNKRSIALNLKHPEGRQIFYRLAQDADVIVEGFRPGVVKRLGVDYATIREINPRIIYCSISGYGQDGPYSNMTGHDINYISFAGVLDLIGPSEKQKPVIPLNLIADYAGGGLHGVVAILSAIIAREKIGRGQYLDIAMTEGVFYMLAALVSDYFARGVVPSRGGTRLNGAAPYYNIYETQDGKYISIGAIEPWFWENLCRALGREDLIPYQLARGEKREELFRIFAEIFKTKTRDEWFQLLKDKDISVGKVYSLPEVSCDPQMISRGMVVEVQSPDGTKVKQVGVAVRLSETSGRVRRTGSVTGEHTEEVLRSLGYTREKIEMLRREEAIQ